MDLKFIRDQIMHLNWINSCAELEILSMRCWMTSNWNLKCSRQGRTMTCYIESSEPHRSVLHSNALMDGPFIISRREREGEIETFSPLSKSKSYEPIGKLYNVTLYPWESRPSVCRTNNKIANYFNG